MSHPEFTNIGHPTDRVIEEMAELTQAIMKAKRFGLFNSHPETAIVNADQIRAEMADVASQLLVLQHWLTRESMEYLKLTASPIYPPV